MAQLNIQARRTLCGFGLVRDISVEAEDTLRKIIRKSRTALQAIEAAGSALGNGNDVAAAAHRRAVKELRKQVDAIEACLDDQAKAIELLTRE